MSKKAQTMANATQSPTSSLTREEIKSCLPKGVAANVDTVTLDHINQLLTDDHIQETFKENLLSFTRVLKEGKFTMMNYVHAVNFVSRKLMGDTNEVAYSMVFPQRYQRLIQQGKSDKTISAHVSSYARSLLVQKITEQTVVPVWVFNQGAVQEAINTQLHIMRNDQASFKVRSDAANSILTHLKQPESTKVEMEISMAENDTLTDLKKATQALVDEQRKALEYGQVSINEVARTKIVKQEEVIEGEFTEKT